MQAVAGGAEFLRQVVRFDEADQDAAAVRAPAFIKRRQQQPAAVEAAAGGRARLINAAARRRAMMASDAGRLGELIILDPQRRAAHGAAATLVFWNTLLTHGPPL